VSKSNELEDVLGDALAATAWLTKEAVVGVTKGGYRLGKAVARAARRGLVVGFASGPLGTRLLPVSVPTPMRLRHMHLEGTTGSGKSTQLVNFAIQDMERGGLIVVDPKGDLVPPLLRHIPSHRRRDVVVLSPIDTQFPVGFNILEGVPENLRTRTASEVVSTFKKMFSDSWGPRLEHVLRYSVLTLLEVPGATLLLIPRLVLEEDFRERMVTHVTNPVVRSFWATEYPQITRGANLGQVTGPILNKIGPFLAYPEVRNVIGQRRSTFSLRQVIDRGMVLLCHLPQSFLGEDASSFLGAMLVSKIQLVAMGRHSGGNYRPVYLYVDEAQNFGTEAFQKILTEARSFSLGLVAANQYREQLPRALQLALDKNVAVRLTSVQERGRYRTIYQELQDPSHEPEILVPAAPVGGGSAQVARAVFEFSRRRYGRPREGVEAEIEAQLGGWGDGEGVEDDGDFPPGETISTDQEAEIASRFGLSL
jgi:hypothetical protein